MDKVLKLENGQYDLVDSIFKTSTVDCLWFLYVVVEWQVLSGSCEICDCLGILV